MCQKPFMHKSCDLTYGLLGDCGPAPPWLPRRVLGGPRGGGGGLQHSHLETAKPVPCGSQGLLPLTATTSSLRQDGQPGPVPAPGSAQGCARPFLLREGRLPPRLPAPFSGLPSSGQGRLWASRTCGGNACGRAAWPPFLSASCCHPPTPARAGANLV